jgi:beta-lactamase regulating signal transducer with metallopeptidase domain
MSLSSVEMIDMLGWFVENTVVAALFAGLVALICVLARPRPAVRHALWLVVLLKLMTPPIVSWPWTVAEISDPVMHWLGHFPPSITQTDPPDQAAFSSRFDSSIPPADMRVVLIPAQEEISPTNFELNPTSGPVDQSIPETSAGHSDPSQEGPSPAPVFLNNLGLSLWCAGAVLMGLWQVWRLARFHRQLTKAVSPPNWLVGEVAELAALLSIRTPKIVLLPAIASPLVWSLGHSRLIWPLELSNRLSKQSRWCVLLHELAHLRRRDHWVSWLQLVGSCLYWWNPLFWFVSRQVSENAELACDAWVVYTLPESRRAFAEALIEVAQLMSTKAAPVPALGLGSGRRRELERRLVMIMSAGIPCKLSVRGLVVVGLLALTALPGWSLGQQEPEKPKAPATPVAVPPPPTPELAPVQSIPPIPPGAEVPPPAIATPYSPGFQSFAGFQYAGVGQNDPDARLKAIEDQLQALLKEVRGMRKGGTRPPTPASTTPYAQPPTTISAGPPPAPTNVAPFPPPSTRGDGAISLTRAVYDLPAGKANALADLLQGSKGPVVEVKMEDDKAIVTTTPEAQQVIGQLIAMLQGKARYVPRTTYQYQAVPVTTYEAAPTKR